MESPTNSFQKSEALGVNPGVSVFVFVLIFKGGMLNEK